MEKFLREVCKCFSAIGIRFFEMPDENRQVQTKILILNSKSVKATGYESEDGFVVRKGSQAIIEETECFKSNPKAKRDRTFLIATGILKEDAEKGVYVFTQDCLLGSPTNASFILLASTSNGLDYWQDENGVSLRNIRLKEILKDETVGRVCTNFSSVCLRMQWR